MVDVIRGHFLRDHGIANLPAEEIFHEGNKRPGAKATFLAATVRHGAGIICHLCPEGINRVFLTPPPHGDARRIASLLVEHPELRRETQRLRPKEQAEYVDAWDRGLLHARDPRIGRRVLKLTEAPGNSIISSWRCNGSRIPALGRARA